jgi:hypothetical protein
MQQMAPLLSRTIGPELLTILTPPGGTVLTAIGEQIIQIYHSVKDLTLKSARQELRAIARLGRN